MPRLADLLENNRQWSEGVRRRDAGFFDRLSRQQAPRYLWIGCADSRVPANEIVGLMPGELFVHRNVANVVVHSDLNCLSVLQYAVEVLRVEHVIVVGHYGCGGVRAAMTAQPLGLIDNWLRHIRDVLLWNREELAAITDLEKRSDRLAELNVEQGVANLCHTTIVQDAWDRGQKLEVHGWIYTIADGIYRDLNVSLTSLEDLDKLREGTFTKKSTGRI